MRMGLATVVAWLIVQCVYGWDVEHNEVACLTGEFLPDEIRRMMRFEDFGILLSNCHYPDIKEWTEEGEDHQYRSLDEIGEAVGEEDKAILRAQGFSHAGWLHSVRGRAVVLALLAKAFGSGDSHKAAFYISVLTHSVSDVSALNHPPLLQFVQYSRFPGVDYPLRKVEGGAKNIFGFRSDGRTVEIVRELLKGWHPTTPDGEFSTIRDKLLVRAVNEGHYSSTKEDIIAFAPLPIARKALAELVVMQIKSILDYVWTAWVFKQSWSMPDKEFDKRLQAKMEAVNDSLDPAEDGVYRGVFDIKQNPVKRLGSVGIVCEPYGVFSITRLSYVGRIITASVARTLRDQGFAILPFALRDVGKGLPSPLAMQVLFVDLGECRLAADQVKAIRDYVREGGCLIAAGGEDRVDVTGFAAYLKRRSDGEVPVSRKWGIQNVNEIKTMSLIMDGVRIPIVRNPNIDGFCKPYAMFSIAEDVSVTSLIRLDNGREEFSVAACRGNVVWLSEYLLMPFVWSGDTSAEWKELRLDSFSRRVLALAFAALEGKSNKENALGHGEWSSGPSKCYDVDDER